MPVDIYHTLAAALEKNHADEDLISLSADRLSQLIGATGIDVSEYSSDTDFLMYVKVAWAHLRCGNTDISEFDADL